jgi:hypothetical protein
MPTEQGFKAWRDAALLAAGYMALLGLLAILGAWI